MASSSPAEDFDILTSLRYDLILRKAQDAEGTFAPSPFYMLEYHRERMLAAVAHFQTHRRPVELDSVASFEAYLTDIVEAWQADTRTPPDQPLKLRVALPPSGRLRTTLAPTPPVGESTLFPSSLAWAGRFGGVLHRLHLDDEASPGAGAADAAELSAGHGAHKTSRRAVYDAARARAGLGAGDYAQPADVILVGAAGDVLEASISTVYFKRNGRWVTPALSGNNDLGRRPCQRGCTRRWALAAGLAVEGRVEASSVRDRELVVTSNAVRGFCLGLVALSPAAKARARVAAEAAGRGRI